MCLHRYYGSKQEKPIQKLNKQNKLFYKKESCKKLQRKVPREMKTEINTVKGIRRGFRVMFGEDEYRYYAVHDRCVPLMPEFKMS